MAARHVIFCVLVVYSVLVLGVSASIAAPGVHLSASPPNATASPEPPRAPGGATVDVLMLITVNESDARFDSAREALATVYRPESPLFGDASRLLPRADAAAALAPRDSDLRAVRRWAAQRCGILGDAVAPGGWGGFIRVTAPVAAAERCLGVPLHMHKPRLLRVERSAAARALRRAPAGRSGSEGRVRLRRWVVAPASEAATEGELQRVAVHHELQGRVALVGVHGIHHEEAQRADDATPRQNSAAADVGSGGGDPYPYPFWPPPAVIALQRVRGTSTEVSLSVVISCPDHPWPTVNLPFEASPTVPAQGQNPSQLQPCSAHGDDGVLSEIIATITPVNGPDEVKAVTTRWVATGPMPGGSGCKIQKWALPGRDGATFEHQVPVCVTLSRATLPDDVTFDISLELKLTTGSKTLAATTVSPTSADSAARGAPQGFTLTAAKQALDIRKQYGVPTTAAVCNDTVQQAIAVPQQPGSGFYSTSDVTDFLLSSSLAPAASETLHFVSTLTPSKQLIEDLAALKYDTTTATVPFVDDDPDEETSLDVQAIMGIGLGADTYVLHSGYFTRAGVPELIGGGFLGLLLALEGLGPDVFPSVISFSYSTSEETVPGFLRSSFNTHAMTLAASGVTIVMSSGDGGAYARGSSLVTGAKPLGLGYLCKSLVPAWPQTSPYVTVVGGTQLLLADAASGARKEMPASVATGSAITSGGGFSAGEPLPDWQQVEVDNYQRDAPMPSLLKHTSTRGYPDVSLLADSIDITFRGRPTTVDGTSASAPLFAGMVTLWNDALVRAGSAPLGHLNPTLYSIHGNDPTDGFTDITTGDNACSDGVLCCPEGFPAFDGWDAVTGLGSVDFQALGDAIFKARGIDPAVWRQSYGCEVADEQACLGNCIGGSCEAGVCNVPDGSDSGSGSSDNGWNRLINTLPLTTWYMIAGGAGLCCCLSWGYHCCCRKQPNDRTASGYRPMSDDYSSEREARRVSLRSSYRSPRNRHDGKAALYVRGRDSAGNLYADM